MISVMSPCVLMARAETPESVNISLSLQMSESGFTIPKQTITIESDLSDQYGFTDAYNGEQVTALDAIVAAHIMVFGDDSAVINSVMTVSDGSGYYDPGFVTNFMGDGTGNFVFYVNSVLIDVIAGDIVLQNGDNLQLFTIQDTLMWSDTYAWFEYEGAQVDVLTVGVNEAFDLTVMGTLFAVWGDWGAWNDVVDGAGIVLIDDATGAFVLPMLVVTDYDGVAMLCFDTAGTYVLGVIDYDFSWEFPLMSPWLVVTVKAPEPTVVNVSAYASVTWVNGPQNLLFITVTETLSDGTTRTIEWNGLINNNAAGAYNVGDYQVFVNTKGNTQIRECYIVECALVA